jgi:N-acetylglucosamine-6-phosphate deacetylase
MYPQVLNPTAELICDFVHIDPEVILMTMKARGLEKVALITDAVASPDAQGLYSCFDEDVIVEQGAVRKQAEKQEDRTLSGSCLTMHQAF